MLYNKETQTQNAEPEEPGKLLLINVSHTVYLQFPKNIHQATSSFKLHGTHEILQH